MRGVFRVFLAFTIAFAALLLSHFPLLRLPFYWDELGQFVPAALDIYHRLAWVPYTTIPNVHPPGVMSYLALVWHVVGFSILSTRVAMLALAACGLTAMWRLAFLLTEHRGAAALGTVFLFCCPLFFSQSEMAQLDMPAMVATTAAFVLFYEEQFTWCALICCVAVMLKETALVAPALFGWVLLRRNRWTEASLFALPLIPLAIWLSVLKQATGHWLGSPAFTDYNLFYPLHPVRLGLALLRRTYYLLIGSGHVIGAVAVIVWLRRSRLSNEFRIVFAFLFLHVLAICLLGGAVLERYLLPVLPVLYAAFGAAIWSLRSRWRGAIACALTAGLLLACVVNPPYPFPMENNLAWTTFVTLGKEAAAFVEATMPGAVTATQFPMAGALRRPEMGYVSQPLPVLEINDFREANVSGIVKARAGALLQYSAMWDPFRTLEKPWWVELLRRYYGYVPQVAPADIPRLSGMRSVFRLCAAGQCMEVFRKVP